jgi:hypothetical protein
LLPDEEEPEDQPLLSATPCVVGSVVGPVVGSAPSFTTSGVTLVIGWPKSVEVW